jgi:hypothetical protein
MRWTLISHDDGWKRDVVPDMCRQSSSITNPRLGLDYSYRVCIHVDQLAGTLRTHKDYEFVVSDDGSEPVEALPTEYRHTVNSKSQTYAEFKVFDVDELEHVIAASSA